ncbi:MAG: hypothetical protein RL742_57 [Bacteroidota bacterium]
MYPDIVIDRFKRQFGHAPEVVVRAPGRINLIGEHTDYNEGLVLPAAIDKAVYFAMSPREDTQLEFVALDLDGHYRGDLRRLEPSAAGWPDYLLGALSELLRKGHRPGGVHVVFGGDLPPGAGLSSSAALETGFLYALNHLFHLGLFKQDVIKIARQAENNFVGTQCGIMDMFAAVMGRADRAICLDCRSLDFDYYPFETNDYTLVLCDTGVRRRLGDSAYNKRRVECETGVALLQEYFPGIESLRDTPPEMIRAERDLLPDPVYQRCLYVAEEIARVEMACADLETGDWRALGARLYESHAGLRDLYAVSCPELDFLVAQTLEMPEIAGARMMGAGFGGCTLNLIQTEAVETCIEKLGIAYRKAFNRELQTHTVKLSEGVAAYE